MSSAGSANGDFLDVIRGRIAAMTDDELLKVVTVEAGDYRKEALDVAWAELRRRGIEAPSPQEVEKFQQQSAKDRQDAPLRNVRWLKFYIFFIAVDLLGELYFVIRDLGSLSTGWLVLRACELGLMGVLLPGMIKRKGWAYYLNWIYLATTVSTMSYRSLTGWRGLLFYFAIWAVPNVIYFRKRRRLFFPPSVDRKVVQG